MDDEQLGSLLGRRPAAFRAEVFGRHHQVARSGFDAAASRCCSIGDVWSLLADDEAFSPLSVSTVAGPNAAPRAISCIGDAKRAFAEGEGLVLAGIEAVLDESDGLMTTLHWLGERLALPVRGITLFVSPGDVSLVPHNDVYEAFTVQLAGAKRWQLFNIVAPGVEITDASIEMPEPTEELVLDPGDVLYVPKGQIHRVVPAGAGVSISAALIYEPPSWSSLISALLESTADHPFFWQSINADDLDAELQVRKSLLVKALLRLEADDVAATLSTVGR